MMQHILLCFIVLTTSISSCQEDKVFGAYEIEEFTFQGHEAKIVFPKTKHEQGLWIWRARFWGHEPQTDIALLEKGFHLVYVDVAGMFGSPKAVGIWNDFYQHISKKYNLNSKVVLEGFSRGGLIVYNWASQNTDKVACIYADAPVCDFKSWPGGLYTGKGSADDWEICLNAYGLEKDSALNYSGIPINTCIAVAKAKIPVIHVYGDADEVVPPNENTELLAETFRKAGGNIELIKKPGVGHHPHSLENPKPIVDFILKHTSKLRLQAGN
ncbi:MAG: alpha/beta hydrolase family protein [Maribacter sp.]